jgi:hypothetical protein
MKNFHINHKKKSFIIIIIIKKRENKKKKIQKIKFRPDNPTDYPIFGELSGRNVVF